MKKTIIILMVIAVVVGGVVLFYNSTKTKNLQQARTKTSNYVSEKSNTNVNTNTSSKKETVKKEVEIATFSTKIYNKDQERQKNITITCNVLNLKEVEPGETFSFCDIVGKATSDKGYEEADIYVNGKKEQGLGGGNCQVSTTLYNAVLQVPELEVLERHQHSGRVPYIEAGRDAAVAYGIYDFKFKNNTESIIKIAITNTVDAITAKLIKIQ